MIHAKLDGGGGAPEPRDLERRAPPSRIIQALGKLGPEHQAAYAPRVLALLEHPEPDVRSQAVDVAFVRWKQPGYRSLIVSMLLNDPHAVVRARAAIGLAATRVEENRKVDIALLLRVLENSHEDSEVRRAAYEALMICTGRLDFPDTGADFNPDRDVDWDWVRELGWTA